MKEREIDKWGREIELSGNVISSYEIRQRWYQCIGQISSIVKDKFWLLNYAANIKLPGCNTPL